MKKPLFFRPWRDIEKRLLSCLLDGKFHSGVLLSSQLNCSRVTIFKTIRSLENSGLTFHRHRRQGYQLISPISRFSIENIRDRLEPSLQGLYEIFCFRSAPRKHFGKRFFEFHRPLADLALCLLDSVPPGLRLMPEKFYAAIAFPKLSLPDRLRLYQIFYASLFQFLLKKPWSPSSEKPPFFDVTLSPYTARSASTVFEIEIDLRPFSFDKNTLAIKVIEIAHPLLAFAGNSS